MLAGQAWAWDFECDGLRYSINTPSDGENHIVSVAKGLTSPTGDFVIPSEVTYPETDGVTYSVTSIGDRAFSECRGLTTITIPESITSIGNAAFVNCHDLTLVIIPNSVTCIGSQAFQNCNNLTSVTIPESVISIGEYAFMGCDNLTKAEFVNIASLCKMQFDGVYANPVLCTHHLFVDGKEITDVVIPDSITSIGNYSFCGCNDLASVSIPESVTSIGDYAFSDCRGLTSVNIPETIKSIGNYAFSGCSSLISITIPRAITCIRDGTFSGCCDLTSATIPESVTSIGEYAFRDCSSLALITIPESVIELSGYAFSGCSSLQYNEYDNALYLGNDGNPYLLLIKAKSTDITSCVISNSCKFFNSTAFNNCSHLTSVTISNSETEIIGWDAFAGCSSLQYNEYNNALYLGNDENPHLMLIKAKSTDITSCEISNSCKLVYKLAFCYCSSLTSITIPNSVTSIGDMAFYECRGLTSVTIGNSVTKIGKEAFNFCSGLTSISIPESVTWIGDYAFYNCRSLPTITIPNSVKNIGVHMFGNCYSLTSITLHDSLISISDGAFMFCRSLTSVSIPESVVSIGTGAFAWCDVLKKAEFANIASLCKIHFGDRSANPLFSAHHLYVDGEEITKVFIPDSVTSIGDYAFSDCSGLTSVSIPNSVTSIGEEAFYGCSALTSVTIPNSVTYIGNAFGECEQLYCEAESKPNTWKKDWNYDNRPVVWGCKSIKIEINDLELGSVQTNPVCGIGINGTLWYTEGATVELTATPKKGYHVKWENGSYENNRTITVAEGSVYSATFEKHTFSNYIYNNDATTEADGTETAVCERGCGANDTRVKEGTKLPKDNTAVNESAVNAINIYAIGSTIVVENATEEIFVYNAMGALVGRTETTTITVNGAGVYIVKTSGTVKRVMVN